MESLRKYASIMRAAIEPKQVGICGGGAGVGVGAGVSVGAIAGVIEGGGVTVTVGVIGSGTIPNKVKATSPGMDRYMVSPPAPLVLM